MKYVTLIGPHAVALVTGQLDTFPAWADPPEGLLGERIAVCADRWHDGTEAVLTKYDGAKFTVKMRGLRGGVGTVRLVGFVRLESPWSSRGVSGKNWPKLPIPRRVGLVHWRVEAPKLEPGLSLAGLERLRVSYEDRPEIIESVRNYGDQFGREKLPADCRGIYDAAKSRI